MIPKLVALDLDGTVVDAAGQIAPRTRAAIHAASARGVTCVIVTGRMYTSAIPYARELNLQGVPLVCYNGAMIRRWPDGEMLRHWPLPVAEARTIARYCEERGYYLHAYVDDQLIVPDLVPEAVLYSHHAGVPAHPVGVLSQWLQRDPTKLLVVAAAERIPALQGELAPAFAGTVQTFRSHDLFLDLVHPEVSKGRALAEVAARLGFAQADVVAMGDAPNDLPMLHWAGKAVAMAHAPPEVQAAADYVCQDLNGGGVAEALEKVVLGMS